DIFLSHIRCFLKYYFTFLQQKVKQKTTSTNPLKYIVSNRIQIFASLPLLTDTSSQKQKAN
ncbi:MAG: hypothetical protein AB1349_10720, partial [Elusimicrobiota bacterium]